MDNFIEEAVVAKSGPVKVNSRAQVYVHTLYVAHTVNTDSYTTHFIWIRLCFGTTSKLCEQ